CPDLSGPGADKSGHHPIGYPFCPGLSGDRPDHGIHTQSFQMLISLAALNCSTARLNALRRAAGVCPPLMVRVSKYFRQRDTGTPLAAAGARATGGGGVPPSSMASRSAASAMAQRALILMSLMSGAAFVSAGRITHDSIASPSASVPRHTGDNRKCAVAPSAPLRCLNTCALRVSPWQVRSISVSRAPHKLLCPRPPF